MDGKLHYTNKDDKCKKDDDEYKKLKKKFKKVKRL